MAESAVSFVIEKLVPFITGEIELQGNLPREMRSIKNELASIKVVLKDAEKKAEEDDGVREWLRQVREIAYQMEDMIDEHVLLEQDRYRREQAQSTLKRCLVQASGFFIQLKPKHDIAKKSAPGGTDTGGEEETCLLCRFIATEQEQGQEQDRHGVNWQDPHHVFSLYVDDTDLVGLDCPKTKILQLMDLENKEVPRKTSVISVVGMGGVGKSTLVRKVYADKQVRQHFSNLCAWVTVSQSYHRVDLLIRMFGQFLRVDTQNPPPLTFNELLLLDEILLGDQLRDYLSQKRYMIVLDDVWDAELWTYMKGVLLSNTKGSILMTTRDTEVALSWTASSVGQVYEMKPLPQQGAWDLFCMRTFGQKSCPSELEKLSQDILAKCEGLPLAIVTIAGLLSTKEKVPIEWDKLHKSLGSELGSNPRLTSSRRILLLSYHELPYYLKPCFLYFGMLPENYSISGVRLVRLWIAEGFVESVKGKTLEDAAQDYLNELVQRNLVQVSRIDKTRRKKGYRIHDILREIIVSKLEESGYCQVLTRDYCPSVTNSRFRRLSVHESFTETKIDNNVSEIVGQYTNKIRSLYSLAPPDILVKALRSSRLLRVLDLQDSPIDHVPKEVGNLIFLHYLSLRNTRVDALPQSVGRLFNLQTLDLKGTLVLTLPRAVSRLIKLRHLLLEHHEGHSIVQIPKEVLQNLQALQKLSHVDGSRAADSLMDELVKLKQLRSMALHNVRQQDGMALYHAIEEMPHLRSLCVSSPTSKMEDEILNLNHISVPPPLLERLSLKGRLANLPNWISTLQNLVKLELVSSRLKQGTLDILQALPNLVFLVLSNNAYDGEMLYLGGSTSSTGFQKLEALNLRNLEKLKSIQGEPPLLGEVCVELCPSLDEDKLSTAIQKVLRKSDAPAVVGMPEFMRTHDLDEDDFRQLKFLKWLRQLNSSRRFRYTLDLKREEEKKQILRKIRSHAQVIRAANLFKEPGGS